MIGGADGSARPGGRPSRLAAVVLYGGAAAAALVAPRLSRRVGRRVAPGVADTVVLSGLAVTGWAVIAAAERIRPFREDWNRSRGDVMTDALDFVVVGSFSQGLAHLVTAPLQSAVAEKRGTGPLARLPLPARVAVMTVAFDFGHTTIHRMLHEKGALWRFHAPHHSPLRLYWGNASRFHPIDSVVDLIQEAFVLSALRADREALLAYRVFRGLYGQIQHCNVDLDSGPLNAVLATPERHRWHHSSNPGEGNSNYGATVSVWDRVLGTDALPDRPFDAAIGNGDPDYPTDFLGQLAAPFR